MKILVISDSHRMTNRLANIFDEQSDADAVIFLGDGESDMDNAEYLIKSGNVYKVRGNCDFCSALTDEALIELAGKRIFFTHGHIYSVKSGYEQIIAAAKSKGADICLFGHTHSPYKECVDSLNIMNPGTASLGQYGIVEIQNGVVKMNLCRL